MTRITDVPRRHWATFAAIAVGLALATALYAVVTLAFQAQRLDASDAARTAQEERVAALEQQRAVAEQASDERDAAIAALRRKLEEEGVDPDTVAPLPPPPPDPEGPSQAQVDRALAAYCRVNDCSRPPPLEPVREFVTAYLTANPPAAGPAGPEGQPGEDAPAVSDAQLDAAVSRYCAAQGGCIGPQGDPGPQGEPGATGPQGQPGRGIEDTQCVGEGRESYWQITYTDGGTSTSPGPCRTAPLVDAQP